jgi:gas vesicle protein/phage tail protein X
MGEDPRAIRAQIDQTRARMGDTVEALSYKTDVKARTGDAIAEKKNAVVNRITGMKDAVVGTASGTASNVGEALPAGEDVAAQARRAAGVAQENPLGLAVGAAAVGFLAGMLLPSTRMEDERIGPAADQVKDTVKETAGEALEHGKQLAQEAAQSAQQTVQERAPEHADQVSATVQQNAGQDTLR